MSKKSNKPVTMASLGMTPGEAELFASGARHLFGEPPEDHEEAKAPASPKGALTELPISGGKKAGPKHVPKKSGSKS